MEFISDCRLSILALIVAIVLIREISKSYRINQFKKLDNSKIESIGNYEKKSKNKNCYFSSWKKKDNN
jgi:hypothetical protein